MFNPTVSVIINTYNRGHHLKRLLDMLSYQTYDNFEVIVVNGPSTDNTEDVLNQYKSIIKIETCPEVNLCASRNIGVKAAAGEIIAFIDDDAVPESKYWIENAVKPFLDSEVGAVGGLVKRINGDLEFAYGVMSIFGDNRAVCSNKGEYETLKGEFFNGTAGGNSFFRLSAVKAVGGFDEYYIYFLDETDLCYRIAKAGYKILHLDIANIYHEAAKSVNRKSPYHLNWDIITQSKGYYIIKATENIGISVEERKARAIASINGWLNDFKWMKNEKKISKEDYKNFVEMATNGIRRGIEDGLHLERKLQNNIIPEKNTFKQYDKQFSKKYLNICMLCEYDIINPMGGIPVYTHMMAKQFVKMGHNVHVISKGEKCELKNINGINVYTVVPEHLEIDELQGAPTCNRILDFSYACFKMTQLLKSVFFIDIVETPIWDTYGLVSAYLEKDIPVVTRLQTPLKMVMDTMHIQQNSDLVLLTRFEEALLRKSTALITISDCVYDTIKDLYELTETPPTFKNYLGIDPSVKAKQIRKDDGKIIIFFVGRLERRKGIDSIMAAIPYLLEKYPNVEFHLAGDYDIYDEVIQDTFKNKFLKDNKKAHWLDHVKFMGKISDEEKEQEFADCDIFVSPSLYESFGIIFIEAMRYGKPVIGCNVGGMKEIIVHEETGLLCEPGDSESFKKCVERLIIDKDKRQKMGQAGLKRLNSHFTDEIMCKGSLEIYQKLINK